MANEDSEKFDPRELRLLNPGQLLTFFGAFHVGGHSPTAEGKEHREKANLLAEEILRRLEEAEKAPKYIFLSYKQDCSTMDASGLELSTEYPKGVTVDEKAGVWEYDGEKYAIGGESRTREIGKRVGPIAVLRISEPADLGMIPLISELAVGIRGAHIV